MITRKPFWIVFLAGVAVLVLLSRFAEQHGGIRASFLKNPLSSVRAFHSRAKPEPPALIESATLSPLKLPATTAKPTPFPTPAEPLPAPAAIATAQRESNQSPAGDLKDSARRLDTIDNIANFADQIFSTQGTDATWTVNQQGLDQQDYHLEDGTAVTAWLGQDDRGVGAVRAQEAMFPNGEVVDRWFDNSGSVQQVMHQYDANHSVSVYYYDNGTDVEAMRIIQNGREIFMKYDRNGRLIQKTIN